MIQNPALGGALQNQTGSTFFAAFLPKMIGLTLIVGSLIFFAVFVMGAIQWISSGGDKQALEGARGKLTNGIIGIVILFASFAIIGLVETFFDINILTIDIGPLIIQ